MVEATPEAATPEAAVPESTPPAAEASATEAMPEVPTATETAAAKTTATETTATAASYLLNEVVTTSDASAVSRRTGKLTAARQGYCRRGRRKMSAGHQQREPETLDECLFHFNSPDSQA
jgi:hypothetical protein